MGKRNRRQKKEAMTSEVNMSPVPDKSPKITGDKPCSSEIQVEKNTKAVKSPSAGDGKSGKITNYFPKSPECRAGQVDNSETAAVTVEEEKELTAAGAFLPPLGLLTPDTTPTKDTKLPVSTRPSHQPHPTTPNQPTPDAGVERPRVAHKLEYAVSVSTGADCEASGTEGGQTGGQTGQQTGGQTSGHPKDVDTEKDARKSNRRGKGRPKKSKQARQVQSPSTTLKDYFPVRRSNRQCKSAIEAKERKRLHDTILSGQEEGVKVEDIPGKGRGVVATKVFHKGDFVVEYHGDHIDMGSARDRETEYAANPSIGCYMYYYQHKNKSYCVDATAESSRIGRLLNHSKSGNCTTKLISIASRPYLILVAAKTIAAGEELVYDYGDRNKDSLQSHPWLAF